MKFKKFQAKNKFVSTNIEKNEMKFLNFFKRSNLLSTDCRLFTLSIGLFVITCSAVFTYILYDSHVKENQQKLILAANTIDIVLDESLKEIAHLMTYVGKEIASQGKEDLNYIANILSNNYEILSQKKEIISCPQFSWANNQHLIVVGDACDSKPEISKKPISVSHRTYASKCPKYPWTFQTSRPTISIVNGLWAIPVAFGVTNLEGKYLGTLITGIEIFKLSHKIQNIINSTNISFLILDEDLRIILQSVNNSIDPKSSFYRDLLGNFDFFNFRTSILKKPIKYKDIEYSFYKKMSDYPYVILTGLDTNFIYKDFLVSAGFQILELWGMGLFCLALLYLFRKKLINISWVSEKDREIFLKQVQQGTHKPITDILKHCENLLDYFQKKGSENYINYKQIKLIGLISEAASNIYSLTSISKMTKVNLNYSFFEVNQTIKECLNIHRNTIIIKEISIKTEFTQNLPPIYADELRFKQMILGLVALAIETHTPQGIIKISTQFNSIDNQKYFILILEDNGLGFNADDIKRMKKMFNTSNFFAGMDLASIEQLVSIHQGTFCLDATLPHGKKFTVTLPYILEKEEIDRPHIYERSANNLGDNVIPFPGST